MEPTERSKWTNPVMWLLVGLPLASVVFGVGLVVIANRESNDAIVDTVKRTAQIQVADLGPDALAAQRGYSAVLRVGGGAVEAIPVKGEFDRRAALRVRLLHPARSADDRVLVLQPTALGWRAVQDVDTGNEWNVRLEPLDGRWRISGRLPKGQQAVLLQPALAGPD